MNVPGNVRVGTTTAVELVGATYRQIDYWTRVHELPGAFIGSGRHRAMTLADLRLLRGLAVMSDGDPGGTTLRHKRLERFVEALRTTDLEPVRYATLTGDEVQPHTSFESAAVAVTTAVAGAATVTLVDLHLVGEPRG